MDKTQRLSLQHADALVREGNCREAIDAFRELVRKRRGCLVVSKATHWRQSGSAKEPVLRRRHQPLIHRRYSCPVT